MLTPEEDPIHDQNHADLLTALRLYTKWERLMSVMAVTFQRQVILRVFLYVMMGVHLGLSAYLWWGRENDFASLLMLGSAVAFLVAAMYSATSIKLLWKSINEVSRDFDEEVKGSGSETHD